MAFLGGTGPPCPEPAWNVTLITDQYAGNNAVLDAKVNPQRRSALCAAHARRYFEELSRDGSSASAVATEANQMVHQFCDDHRERYLLAFVYGYLGDHDLLAVRTEAEKYMLLAVLNLVECLAEVGAKTPS